MNTPFEHIPDEIKESLFNKSQFRADLTISKTPIPAYKKCIKEATEKMSLLFKDGMDIEQLVYSRAWFIDQVLRLVWEHLNWNRGCPVALLAVGGYGRGELHPGSDIDILILLEEAHYEQHQTSIEEFLTLLWDIGLQVGSSVRSLKECAEQAASDLTIITNLMESRVISGPESLHIRLMDSIDTEHMWHSQRYLQAKFDEQRARHRKYNDTEYDLEPNLKGSPGGLRDLHMLGWVARRHYGTHDPAELLELGFLTTVEYQQLQKCRAFLWKIRWALHTLTGRSENRLLFDHQKALANEFGYHDHTGALAVEQFMQSYFRTAMIVSQLKDLLLQHFDDNILSAHSPQFVRTINDRFQICNNYIETVNDSVFAEYPPAILEMFVLMTRDQSILGPTAETIRLMRDYRHLVDRTFRKDPRCNKLFLELMRAPYALTATLRRLARYGILGRYLPEFGKIIGQMQYDLFHTLTVDAHTLLLIKYLRSFAYGKTSHEKSARFPIASRIIHRIPKPELLNIAALYHDIGKGRGGDHSQLGAVDAQQFCRTHGLNKDDTSLIVWLVQEHLTMSVTAQKKDLSDPQVIQDFARQVGTRDRLKYLYLLTVADINATNPGLWNGWRASLLQQLYNQTLQLLKRGIDKLPDLDEQIAETQEQAQQLLIDKGFAKKQINDLWHLFNEDYFQRHQSEEIVWQTEGILNHLSETPLILIPEVDEDYDNQGSCVFVYTPDRPNLFAAIVAAFHQLGLAIQDARIITSDNNFSLDTFRVLEEDGSAIGANPARIREIQHHLQNVLAAPDGFPNVIRRRTPRQLRHFSREPEVIISNQIDPSQTVLEITATDRPGLLTLIGKTFAELELQVQGAKIATFGEKVEDSFFISDRNMNPIEDEAMSRKICSELCDVLREASKLDAITS
ncbi:[protein-PII] uridylyltransferase [uncultured Endozoicomonas sp.]|uniref:[protein-PII] uridylyltransferase n=1 Tax=uncultured Endozoicomonas sp. TaxID=432652 RepID=UPI0026086CF7|nr:[protein-PII] uridylyltransferase [uncultured Endozoicomonas sp.]